MLLDLRSLVVFQACFGIKSHVAGIAFKHDLFFRYIVDPLFVVNQSSLRETYFSTIIYITSSVTSLSISLDLSPLSSMLLFAPLFSQRSMCFALSLTLHFQSFLSSVRAPISVQSSLLD